jgi:hypothetical protein
MPSGGSDRDARRGGCETIVSGPLESAGMLLTVLTPLVAVPLTVITFYLRSMREHQISRHAELVRRMDSVEDMITELRKTLGEFERDYTTKEEWLRECMQARRTLEQVREATIRMDTAIQSARPTVTSPPHGRRRPGPPGRGK